MRVYFARAVNGCDWQEVQSARDGVLRLFSEHGLEVINEFSNGYDSAEDLVEGQIANIRRCDILIADLSIPDHPYLGCIGEVIYAHQFGKPVYVVYGNYDRLLKRPWLTYHTSGMFRTYGELFQFLERGQDPARDPPSI
jgi:nucleoside 2-deoxyribosyltransferase